MDYTLTVYRHTCNTGMIKLEVAMGQPGRTVLVSVNVHPSLDADPGFDLGAHIAHQARQTIQEETRLIQGRPDDRRVYRRLGHPPGLCQTCYADRTVDTDLTAALAGLTTEALEQTRRKLQ